MKHSKKAQRKLVGELALWEIELIELRKARRREIASLNKLAARQFTPKIIRRKLNRESASSNQLDSVSS